MIFKFSFFSDETKQYTFIVYLSVVLLSKERIPYLHMGVSEDEGDNSLITAVFSGAEYLIIAFSIPINNQIIFGTLT